MSKILECAVLMAASLLLTTAAHSEADHIHAGTVGQHGFMDADWYLCSSWDIYRKYDRLMKDDAAAAVILADRDCTKVRDQTEVVVEDTNTFWRPYGVCVRPIGQPDCGWVLPGFVTTALCKPVYVSRDKSMTCAARKTSDDPQRPWSAGYSGN
jgi:hypothetical protein